MRRAVVRRFAAAAAVAAMAGALAVPAGAIEPPPVLAAGAPPDGPPGPELPTQQKKQCQSTGVLANSDLGKTPPPYQALELAKTTNLATGAGVTVAVLDTGVNPHPRLPAVVPGGDYVQAGGDALADCDAHGTLVAGIISGRSDPGDGFVGVAPQARVLSVRVRSEAFEADRPQQFDDSQQLAMDVRTLARAIVHAANLGAQVITVPRPICLSLAQAAKVDQSMLSAAVGYAVRVRGALVVVGAGDAANKCKQNPEPDPARPADPRNWTGVETIATPAWFASDVLTVGFTTAAGTAMPVSLNGPWVSVAAPGTSILSLAPGGRLVNGIGGQQLAPVGGSAFAAAYVSGVAALLRSRFPHETPLEIAARLQAAAHNPARGIDNTVGAGMIDPVASLSYRTPPARPDGLWQRPLHLPPSAPRDRRPVHMATAVAAGAVAVSAVIIFGGRLIRRRP